MSSVRILGIDPGTAIVGWAIVDDYGSGKLKQVAYGCIITDKEDSDTQRLVEIMRDLDDIIKQYVPKEVGVEQLFFFKNQKTIITVAQARGVILATTGAKGLLVAEYTPLQIKQSLTGYGRASKRQVQEMVMRVFDLDSVPQPDDAADALAVAFCHSASRRIAQASAK